MEWKWEDAPLRVLLILGVCITLIIAVALSDTSPAERTSCGSGSVESMFTGCVPLK
jgi:hypothetical protein